MDPSFYEPVQSSIPTLILSGEIDPVTPPGLYDLVYRDPRGESVLAGAFHYLDNIRVVTPSRCVPEGGTAIAFEGYELENGWIPRLGGVPCEGGDAQQANGDQWPGAYSGLEIAAAGPNRYSVRLEIAAPGCGGERGRNDLR